MVLSARRGQCGQRPTSIGRVLCVETLTARSTAAAWKCLLITRKIIIPPPDSEDPTDGPPYFMKKNVSPLTAGTHQLHLCTQGSASILRGKNDPPDYWDPPATSLHARKCLTVGTHLVEVYIVLSFWSRTCTYILVDVQACMCRSRGAHML